MVNRHPDVRPEWVIRAIESSDYEWTEYSTTPVGDLVVQTILVGYIAEVDVWVKVVFEGYLDGGKFHTAHQLRRRQMDQIRSIRERRR